MGETVGGGRPDLGGGIFFENEAVALEGLGIPVVEFRALFATSFCRSVVEVLAEDNAAEIVPIAASVNEVEVPGLIDFFRWGDGVSGDHGEGEEAFVFLDDPRGEDVRPGLLTGEAAGEGEGGAGVIEFKSEDALEEVALIGCQRICHCGELLQRWLETPVCRDGVARKRAEV